MIEYPNLMKMLADKGITSYTVRKNGKIGQATWKVLTEGGHINTRTIDALCEMLGCQPGDFLRYVPDNPTTEDATKYVFATVPPRSAYHLSQHDREGDLTFVVNPTVTEIPGRTFTLKIEKTTTDESQTATDTSNKDTPPTGDI